MVLMAVGLLKTVSRLGDLEDGTNLSYCHPPATGAELAYGAGVFDVVEGSTTLFPDNFYSTAVTYIVDDRSSADALAGLGDSTLLILVVTRNLAPQCDSWSTYKHTTIFVSLLLTAVPLSLRKLLRNCRGKQQQRPICWNSTEGGQSDTGLRN